MQRELVKVPVCISMHTHRFPLHWRMLLAFRYRVWYRLYVGKIRRGNYIFLSWIGDHPPRHVHVYKDGEFVVKWDLENHVAMKGEANNRILKLIAELEREGRL